MLFPFAILKTSLSLQLEETETSVLEVWFDPAWRESQPPNLLVKGHFIRHNNINTVTS